MHRMKAQTSPQISFSPDNMTSPSKFGSKMLKDANSISENYSQKSIQQVLEETPRARLVRRPDSRQRLSNKRQILREIKNQIQTDMNSEGDTLILHNIRIGLGLSSSKRKITTTENAGLTRKRRHGCHPDTLTFDKDQLLQEARLWQPNEQVNWSQLGLRYGRSEPNRGQVIKEYLAEQGIQVAQNNQRKRRAPLRSKMRLRGGKVTFPMYSPVQKLQKKVSETIESGDIPIGQEVVQTAFLRYTVQEELTLENTEVYAHKIPLLEIRKRLLNQHELGILRQNPDE